MDAIVQKGTAVITGASSGIGAVYADRLADQGYDLILVARNRGRLMQLADRLTTATGQSIEVVDADLGNEADLRRVEKIVREDASISMLVNNAGIGGAAPLLDSEVDKMESMINLNVIALMRLTYAIAPRFVERGAGTIVNISSIVAVAPEILNGVYGGTKAFVLAFSQSLHHELFSKGVRVQAVLPGATRTEFWDIAGQPVDNLPEAIVMAADDLVDAALAGLDLGELATVPSLPEEKDWAAFETARAALGPNLSHSKPAARYNVA
ncbi:short-subunit dehydrogenase [Paraburkholderia sp. GAS199]|uniref:SDR family NAD(P)-dependent oxidoreductase n=1 Tax=Paraburkholderia sp. GAS199 TaxID=3035126 RepID=UPI003D254C58